MRRPSLIIAFLLPLLTACATATPTLPVVPTQAPPVLNELPVNDQGTAVVARVNGTEITRAEFDRALMRTQQANVGADATLLYTGILDSLIEQRLIEQAATELNVSVTDAQIDAELQANKELVTDATAWEKWLNDNLYTEAEYRDSLRASMIANAVLAQVASDLPQNVLQVHARHILVETEAEANAMLARLQNGEDFATLAANYSRDVTTRERGGDLGWFMDGQLLEEALTQVAFAIEPGQIAGPIQTRLGYHVLEVIERGEQPLPEDSRSLLLQLTFEKWLEGLTFNAVIERYLTT